MSGELRATVIGLVIFSGVLGGMLTYSGGLFNQYDAGISNSTTFDQFEDIRGEARNETSSTISRQRNATTGIGGGIASGVFIIGQVFQGLVTVFSSLTVIPIIVATFAQAAGLPTWVEYVINSIIVVIVMFTIYSAYRAYEV